MTKILLPICAELTKKFDAETSRRLNKLLIARIFPDSLKRARVNLLTLFTWKPVKVRFQVLNAQEAFMIWIKAALVTGLVLASPYVLYQLWMFVAAGLYPHEKNYVYIYLPISDWPVLRRARRLRFCSCSIRCSTSCSRSTRE